MKGTMVKQVFEQSIVLTVTDAALQDIKSVLAIEHISGEESLLREPMLKIFKGLQTGKNVRLKLKEE